MKSDTISVSNSGRSFEVALQEAEAVAVYKKLPPRSAIHLRLLTEEMMSMMRSIAGPAEGEFWISDETGVYELHLRIFKRLTEDKREQLISAASSRKNEAEKGFLGKLRSFFDYGDPDTAMLVHDPLLTGTMDGDFSSMQSWEWSMVNYRDSLSQTQDKDDQSRQAWDELERSVIATVADEIKVNIKGPEAELIVYKKMA